MSWDRDALWPVPLEVPGEDRQLSRSETRRGRSGKVGLHRLRQQAGSRARTVPPWP